MNPTLEVRLHGRRVRTLSFLEYPQLVGGSADERATDREPARIPKSALLVDAAGRLEACSLAHSQDCLRLPGRGIDCTIAPEDSATPLRCSGLPRLQPGALQHDDLLDGIDAQNVRPSPGQPEHAAVGRQHALRPLFCARGQRTEGAHPVGGRVDPENLHRSMWDAKHGTVTCKDRAAPLAGGQAKVRSDELGRRTQDVHLQDPSVAVGHRVHDTDSRYGDRAPPLARHGAEEAGAEGGDGAGGGIDEEELGGVARYAEHLPANSDSLPPLAFAKGTQVQACKAHGAGRHVDSEHS
mmetsp:Transcript_144696/g.463652  ORF Transcript_144696/g.463652 Transcript_144696/m.463652 type:complete len:296 (-) Transcript_144696:1030-1917(-)